MLMPAIFGSNLFDGWMDDEFRDLDKMDREMNKKLYGHEAGHVMKTDVRELADHYEVDIDLPGFKKDEISAKLENGYLTVSAAKKMRRIKPAGIFAVSATADPSAVPFMLAMK